MQIFNVLSLKQCYLCVYSSNFPPKELKYNLCCQINVKRSIAMESFSVSFHHLSFCLEERRGASSHLKTFLPPSNLQHFLSKAKKRDNISFWRKKIKAGFETLFCAVKTQKSRTTFNLIYLNAEFKQTQKPMLK